MTVNDAISRARAIQADLEAGRLTVPYPDPVTRELVSIGEVLIAHCRTPEQARDIVARLHAPAAQARLPW